MSNQTTLIYLLVIKDDYISKFKRILNGEPWDIIGAGIFKKFSKCKISNYIPNGKSNLYNQFESGPTTWDIYANRITSNFLYDINYRKCKANLFTSKCYIQEDTDSILKFCELIPYIAVKYYVEWWDSKGIRGKFANCKPKTY